MHIEDLPGMRHDVLIREFQFVSDEEQVKQWLCRPLPISDGCHVISLGTAVRWIAPALTICAYNYLDLLLRGHCDVMSFNLEDER